MSTINIRRWLFWLGASAVSGIACVALFSLHAVRPTDTIIVKSAQFVESRSHSIPDALGEGVVLPDDWRQRTVNQDTGWYKAKIDFNVAPDRLWGIYIPSLEMTPSVFINGVSVGNAAKQTGPLPRYWNRPVYYTIPSGVLKPGGNTIHVRIQANDIWGRLAEFYIGPDVLLEPAYSARYFMRVTILYITATVSFFVALFIGALTFLRRERVYAWFSAFAFAWCLQNITMLTVNLPVPNKWWDLFVYTTMGYMLMTGALFTFRFLNVSYPKWEKTLVIVAISGPLVLAALSFIDRLIFNAVGSMIWLGILVMLSSLPIILLIRYTLTQDRLEHFFLSVCFMITVPLSLHDWLVTAGFSYRHNGFLMQFAAGPMLATFGVILVRRFITALKETDDLNRDLLARVDEKTQEIEASYAHTRELESEQLIANERERLMRDMHDGVGGQLIGTLARLNRNDPRDAEIAAELGFALTDLRLMIDSMDTVDNDVVAVLGLFRNRVQQQLDDARIHLKWNVSDLPPVELGPERTLHFLRIIQEAVTNIIKHAQANNIQVETQQGETVDDVRCSVIDITDDGIGLAEVPTQGRGLMNMKHRAREAALKLSITREQRGTRVRIGFPLISNEC